MVAEHAQQTTFAMVASPQDLLTKVCVGTPKDADIPSSIIQHLEFRSTLTKHLVAEVTDSIDECNSLCSYTQIIVDGNRWSCT